MFLKYLILGCLFLSPLCCTASDKAVPPGFMQGHLRIVSPKPVELADGNAPALTTETYTEYPLDGNGNYRVALPPGAYILDVQDRARKHVRAKPQRFTVVSNQTVRVDMDIDTGIR